MRGQAGSRPSSSALTRRAVEAGYLTSGDAEAWLDHLRAGRLFASATRFLTLAGPG